MRLAEIPASRTIPEKYKFAPPVSPHLAARLAGARIELRQIKMPRLAANEALIVEGAGGALVPINRTQLMTDLMKHLKLPVLLVARTSLGTINHTLLSLAALRSARLECARRGDGWQTERRKSQSDRTLWRNRGGRRGAYARENKSHGRLLVCSGNILTAELFIHELRPANLAPVHAGGSGSAADSHCERAGRLPLHRRWAAAD